MKKGFIFCLVFFLILSTSIVKNSTKKIDDKVFSLKENIFNLNSELENTKLEFDYLSSAEKLMYYQNEYFENKLDKKNFDTIKVINFFNKDVSIENISILDDNEK